jgi:threonine dehydrogenase-like Zn-dependent dehydrogenase
MRAAVLEDVTQLKVQTVPDPVISSREVVLKIQAVGVCGTDMHIYHGDANYHLDSSGRPIPLAREPQILGHEFTGEVVAVGREVKDLKPGDRVACDQGLNCHSHNRDPLCSYCATGNSHQCEFYQEHGITGLQGAMAEYLALPAVNCLKIEDSLPAAQAAMVEPLACIFHASDLAERAHGRYTFTGPRHIRNILICGAGPAGLLFLQYLRKVLNFDGLIMISDLRARNLELARQFGGAPIDVSKQSLIEAVQEMTRGERVHYLVEATGNPVMFELMPGVLRKQATVLLYGHGHKGKDLSLICNVLFMEPMLIAPIGASGGFDADFHTTLYRRSLAMLSAGRIRVAPFITHEYKSLDEVHTSFESDFSRPDYIKGVLSLS